MAYLSPAEAVRQFNVSKPTLYKDMEKGRLSFTVDDRKRRKIDVSELNRIYALRENHPANKTLKYDNIYDKDEKFNVNPEYIPKSELLSKEIEFLKSRIDQQQDEIDKWKEAHDKAQSTAEKITLLLEDQREKESRGDNWEKSLKALEQRLANQEKTAKEREVRERKLLDENRRIRQAYSKQKKEFEKEKNKSVWKKLFG